MPRRAEARGLIVRQMALIDRFRRRPPAPDRPRSHSGRAHTDGFLEVDELNAKLIGVAGLRVFDE
ncbi:MAG: hypothetical protein ACRD2Z_15470, partial [Thermoanaerobaculia bacterium]